ncbi:hypothetical protein V1478_005441 [Vespula squamosa]|uniref:Uncharacterized protein n=1 Tax=Vespula squamosa TaxID=30214 RepID=A0ABD2BEY0_VESSQ
MGQWALRLRVEAYRRGRACFNCKVYCDRNSFRNLLPTAIYIKQYGYSSRERRSTIGKLRQGLNVVLNNTHYCLVHVGTRTFSTIRQAFQPIHQDMQLVLHVSNFQDRNA